MKSSDEASNFHSGKPVLGIENSKEMQLLQLICLSSPSYLLRFQPGIRRKNVAITVL